MTDRQRYQPPDELTKHVTAICGAAGVQWLADLRRIVAELESKWGITTEPAFEKGEYNFVSPARSETIDAVLKIAPPFPTVEIFAEAELLRILNGRGAPRLLQEDRENRAILIERIRPGVTMDVYFADDPFACVAPAIKVLRSILLPPPYPPAEAQLFYNWYFRFQRALETDFPREYVLKAMTIFDPLFQDDEHTFHLHGDFHPGNVISSQDGFAVIDPKGLVGHITYDIAVFLNNLHWWQKGKAGVKEDLFAAARQFADAFGIEEIEIRRAAYAGMVIGAWWNFEDMPEHYDNEVVFADIWEV